MAYKIIDGNSFEFVEGRKLLTFQSAPFDYSEGTFRVYSGSILGFEALASVVDPLLLSATIVTNVIYGNERAEVDIMPYIVLTDWSSSSRTIQVYLNSAMSHINYFPVNGSNLYVKFVLAVKDE